MKKARSYELFYVALFSTICAILSFLYYLIKDNGFFSLASDFNYQQIPFNIALHNILQEGNPAGWIWNYDLGCSILYAFSFYALGSPFFWLYMLFPANSFPYLVIWIYVLKYVLAAVFAFLYFARFVNNKRNATIGALLYAFSGFQAVNLMFYHFHDAVAVFPLMLIGIEKLVENPKDKGLFVFSVFLNCIVNYFFFVQNVIFIIFYFVIRFWSKDIKRMLPLIGRCLLCGLWGTMMAAILFVPSIIYIVNTSRIYSNPLQVLLWPRYFLYVIKGILFPTEAMNNQSSLFQMEWRSVGCYLPMVGFSLCLTYLIKKRDWLFRILILLILMSFLPILSGVFNLYSGWYYRWWYFLVLLGSLASIRVIDNEREYNVKLGVGITLALIVALYLFMQFAPWVFDNDALVYEPGRFLLYAGIAIVGTVLVYVLYRLKLFNSRWLLLGVCVFATLTTTLALYFFGENNEPDNIRNMVEVGMQLETPDEQYRYISGNNIYNMTGGASGTSIFSSTVTYGSKQFDLLFDYNETILTFDKLFIAGLPELVAGKYMVSNTDNGNVIEKMVIHGKSFYVLERDACPIGYKTDGFITIEDLMRHEKAERSLLLLNAAVIDSSDEQQLNGVCRRITGEEDTITDIGTIVEKNKQNAVTNFSRNSHGFRCEVNYDSASAIYFSVPYDKGWSATIDNQNAEIINSGGMMLMLVPAGYHQVVFDYVTPGYQLSKYISLVAWIVFLIYLVLHFFHYKKDSVLHQKNP